MLSINDSYYTITHWNKIQHKYIIKRDIILVELILEVSFPFENLESKGSLSKQVHFP